MTNSYEDEPDFIKILHGFINQDFDQPTENISGSEIAAGCYEYLMRGYWPELHDLLGQAISMTENFKTFLIEGLALGLKDMSRSEPYQYVMASHFLLRDFYQSYPTLFNAIEWSQQGAPVRTIFGTAPDFNPDSDALVAIYRDKKIKNCFEFYEGRNQRAYSLTDIVNEAAHGRALGHIFSQGLKESIDPDTHLPLWVKKRAKAALAHIELGIK